MYLGDTAAQISRAKSSQENGHGTEKGPAKCFSSGLGGKYPHFFPLAAQEAKLRHYVGTNTVIEKEYFHMF